MGLSGLFRSPWIPLGISVGDHGLEIAGLDSRSGLIIGDFRRWSSAGDGCLGFRFGVRLGSRLRSGFCFRFGGCFRFGFGRLLVLSSLWSFFLGKISILYVGRNILIGKFRITVDFNLAYR